MKRTVKSLPPIAKGGFEPLALSDVNELEIGDVIYVPNYRSFASSTLRANGLSIGNTRRAANSKRVVNRIFGRGHQSMVLIVSDLDRAVDNPLIVWDRFGLVLANNQTSGDNQVGKTTAKRPQRIVRASFIAIPTLAFSAKNVSDILMNAAAADPLLMRGSLSARLRQKTDGKIGNLFLLRNDCMGLDRPGPPQDTGSWVAHALLDYARQWFDGIAPSGHRSYMQEPWQANVRVSQAEYATTIDELSDEVAENAVAVPTDSWANQNLVVMSRGTGNIPLFAFLRDHGCTFMRRQGFCDEIVSRLAWETANKTADRIAEVGQALDKILSTAAQDVRQRLASMADAWRAVGGDVDPETFASLAKSFVEIQPNVAYNSRRRSGQ